MNIKKYLQFKGTLNGLNYFLRNLLSVVLAFLCGYAISYGDLVDSHSLVIISFLFLGLTLWFSFATLWKRVNALFPKNATLFTTGLIFIQLAPQFLPQESDIKPILSLFLFIASLILIFKNSEINNHNG